MGISLETVAQRCRDAAFGDCDFEAVLRAVCGFVGGEKALLMSTGCASDIGVSQSFGHNPSVLADYRDTWRRDDPRRFQSLNTEVGEAALGQSYRRNEDIAMTPYYDAIALRGNVADSVHGIIADTMTTGRLTISVHRGFQHERFVVEQRERLAAVLPMLKSAVEDSLRSALLAGGVGKGSFYAVLDHGAKVAFAGGAPDVRIALGLGLDPHEGACASLRFRDALKSAVAQARKGHRVALRHAALDLEITPLPVMLGWKREWQGMVMLVARKRDRDEDRRALALYAGAHEFTLREREMLGALMEHGEVRRAAESLAVSYETARWHVRNMLGKSHQRSVLAMVKAVSERRLDV